ADRAYPHGARGELPEVGHQPGMRIRRESARALRRRGDLLAEMRKVLLAEPSFEERAGVDAGRAVRLEEHEVSALRIVAGAEEMMEAGLEEVGRARIRRGVPAELPEGRVGANDHRERIPAHDRSEPLLDREIPREHGLRIHC